MNCLVMYMSWEVCHLWYKDEAVPYFSTNTLLVTVNAKLLEECRQHFFGHYPLNIIYNKTLISTSVPTYMM